MKTFAIPFGYNSWDVLNKIVAKINMRTFVRMSQQLTWINLCTTTKLNSYESSITIVIPSWNFFVKPSSTEHLTKQTGTIFSRSIYGVQCLSQSRQGASPESQAKRPWSGVLQGEPQSPWSTWAGPQMSQRANRLPPVFKQILVFLYNWQNFLSLKVFCSALH